MYTEVQSLSSHLCFCVCVSAATLLKSDEGSIPEGKVKIRLEHDGTFLEVDEDDVEKVGSRELGLNHSHLNLQYTRLSVCFSQQVLNQDPCSTSFFKKIRKSAISII